MNTGQYKQAAEKDLLGRYKLKRYRHAARCKKCGAKVLIRRKDSVCFGCVLAAAKGVIHGSRVLHRQRAAAARLPN